MLENYTLAIYQLEAQHLIVLQRMGFCKYGETIHRLIDNLNERAFFKPYDICGVEIRLSIDLYDRHVAIKTPSDVWGDTMFDVKEFIDEMTHFKTKVIKDIKALQKSGIIAE